MEYNGQRVTIMGLGHFGGGVAAARWLARQGAIVTVTDLADENALADALPRLADVPIAALHLGGHREEDFRHADLVVVNPAVRPNSPWLQVARQSGARLCTELELFIEHCPATIIGVTGTNGKSTTAAMIAQILRCAQDDRDTTFLGGNIGGSLLEELPQIGPNDWVVLEISSFQLWYFTPEVKMPHVAVVTGCQPNHLDWHSDFAEYVSAKQRILAGQTPADFAVLNTLDAEVATWAPLVRGRQVMLPSPEVLIPFAGVASGQRLVAGEEGRETGRSSVLNQQISNPPSPPAPLPQAGEGSNGSPSFSASTTSWCPPQVGEGSYGLSVPGEHNRINAACAAAAASAVGCTDDDIRRGLDSFQALPQRLEWFATVEGRRFYNDSAATTPESTIAALRSLEVPIWLLAGGKSKGADFDPLAAEMVAHARGAAMFGAAAREISDRVAAHSSHFPCVTVDTMAEALQWCWTHSRPGDAILLSPACASTDQFRNFQQRGQRFVELVHQLRG